MLRAVFTFLCVSLVLGLDAQDKSNRGKEFWLAYGFDYSFFHETPVNNQELAIYISTELAANVTVSITGTGYTQTLSIPANTVDATILIPKSGANDARTLTDGLQNRGIHIVSDVPVAVYAHVYSTQVSGATMLMPVETYGYSYHSINYYQTTSESSPADWYSWFYAIATEDNTRLEITPSDTTKNGWLPGQTYVVNLNKGQSYHVFGKAIFDGNPANASKDMTGSKIVSVVGGDGVCHPVAVFSGSGGIRLCRGDGGEFMHQQVFPSQAWGTRYLTYHTINNVNTNITETNRNYYRVCVADPSTIVKRNGTILAGLQRNFYYEFMDSTGGDYIEANKPILVSQYTPNKNQCWNFPTTTPSPPSYGDPEMFYLSPIEQGQKSVLFYVSRRSSIDYVYTNIHVPTAAVASLRVDGAALPAAQIIPHPNLPSYSVALARFIGPAAQHRITADSAFTATVYGLGNYESYGYNVGTLINNLNHYSSIKNVNSSLPVDTFTCKSTPVRLYVKVAHPASSITWRLSQVPGIFPNADSMVNNPIPVNTELINGRTYYVYSLAQDFTFNTPGTYYLPIAYSSTVIPNCNQTDTASVRVVVKPGPQADFSWPPTACLQDTIPFTGTSLTGPFTITGYRWLFDDNSTASTMNVSKRFATGGNHDVRFRVIANNGCEGDTVKTVSLANSPVAKFGVTASICQGDSVYITDTSSIGTGSISTWYYDFGDGYTVYRNRGAAFYHQYTTAGNFTISLVVTASGGCRSDTVRRQVTVTALNNNLGPDITQCSGTTAILDPQAGAGPHTFLWQDGSTGSTFNATLSGLYWVAVSNGSGCTRRDSINVNFTAAPSFNLGPDRDICAGDTLTLSAAVANATSYLWNNGSTQSSLKVYQAGLAWCEVSRGTCSYRDSIIINSVKPKPIVNLGPDQTVCEGITVTLDAANAGASYLWQNGSTTSSYTVSGAGIYSVEVTSNGCKASDTVRFVYNPKPVFDLGPDQQICQGLPVVLKPQLNPSWQLNWQDGSSSPTYTVTLPGTYVLRVSNNCGSSTDQVQFSSAVCSVYLPSAFTPNGDSRNDEFKVLGTELITSMQLKIFNRYGQVVFETADKNRGWDGKFKGSASPAGGFVYLLSFKDLNSTAPKMLKGSFLLIR